MNKICISVFFCVRRKNILTLWRALFLTAVQLFLQVGGGALFLPFLFSDSFYERF